MVPLRLSIDSSFFLAEEREGYFVSKEMKEVWAVLLDLLNEFARVCEEHHLEWFAHAGTMLGAVRHHGFIPWDDDIDIVMPRDDYEKLCRIGPSCFSFPYFYQCEDSDRFFCRNFSRLRNSETTAIQYLEKDLALPYNQGIFIDIFPYDNISDNEDELASEIKLLEALACSSWQSRNMVHFYSPKRGKGVRKRLNYYLKHLWFKYVDKRSCDYLRLLNEYKDLVTKHNDEVTRRVGEMIIPPLGRQIWNREWVSKMIWVPFEMIQIPVPVDFCACLNASFGKDWRIPRQQENYHGRVLFDVNHPWTDYYAK